MNKLEFLLELEKGLEGFPQNDIEEQIAFYGEMIDDRIEDGMSEEDAVAQIGSVDKIIEQILTEIPLVKIVKEKAKPKRLLKVWEIVLLVLGSPIWLSILISLFAVILSVYISLWAIIISLWATDVALIGSAFGGIVAAIGCVCKGSIYSALVMFASALICSGLAIFFFFGCREITRAFCKLTKRMVMGVKYLFIGKGKSK